MGVNRGSPYRPGQYAESLRGPVHPPRQIERTGKPSKPKKVRKQRPPSGRIAQQPHPRDYGRPPVHADQQSYGMDREARQPVRRREKNFSITTALAIIAIFAVTGGVTFVARKMTASSESLGTQEGELPGVPVEATTPPPAVLPPTTIAPAPVTAPQPTEAPANPTTTHEPAPTTTQAPPTEVPAPAVVDFCAIPPDLPSLTEEQISAIQSAYLAQGHYGENADPSEHVDGDYGRNTTNAEDKFQQQNGIDINAGWDEQTRNALFGC